jgi:EipB-like
MRHLVASVALLASAGQAMSGVVLLPHRAIYEMTATNIDKKSGIISATGLLAFEISGSTCDGWTSTYRIATRYVRNEKGEQLTDTQVSNWEAGDGGEYHMEEKQLSNRQLVSQTNLSATLKSGEEGEVHATRPVEKDVKIPKDVIFPLKHEMHLIAAATEGKEYDSSTVFEGSDELKSNRAITVIGKMQTVQLNSLGIDEKSATLLTQSPAWPMSVAYYPANPKAADAPDYQTSFTMFANGVSTNLLFDYGAYAMRGKLTKLEFLPVSKCP